MSAEAAVTHPGARFLRQLSGYMVGWDLGKAKRNDRTSGLESRRLHIFLRYCGSTSIRAARGEAALCRPPGPRCRKAHTSCARREKARQSISDFFMSTLWWATSRAVSTRTRTPKRCARRLVAGDAGDRPQHIRSAAHCHQLNAPGAPQAFFPFLCSSWFSRHRGYRTRLGALPGNRPARFIAG